MIRFLIVAIAASLSACSVAVDRTHPVVWLIDEDDARKSGEDFDWQHRGPLDFIRHLQKRLTVDNFPVYTVWSYHRKWIHDSDLPALRTLIDS